MSWRIALSVGLLAVFFVAGQHAAYADETTDSLEQQIAALRNEIEQLTIQLGNTTAQKQTLQNAIKELELQIKKLQKSISLTNSEILRKDKEIGKLSGNIAETGSEIARSQAGVAEILRELKVQDDEPAMNAFLGGGTLSSFFDEAAALGSLRDKLHVQIEDLSALKNNLQTNKSTAESRRRELANLQANLSQQRQGLTAAKSEQDKLLSDTKNRESSYQALIAQKKEQEAQFEKELLDYAKQLGLSVAAGSVPGSRPGILQWPLDSVRITQYFGYTDFATKNPQIYGGKGHNAIDFGASTGTRVKAALGGAIKGTGNTDLQRGCYSYGKWVLIEHPNGLSTLYAHLSVISVEKGQQVGTGEVVGLAGSTGYATGPHLHFGVYASSGTQIAQFSKSVNCKNVSVPIADQSAYLNPLSYLPAL